MCDKAHDQFLNGIMNENKYSESKLHSLCDVLGQFFMMNKYFVEVRDNDILLKYFQIEVTKNLDFTGWNNIKDKQFLVFTKWNKTGKQSMTNLTTKKLETSDQGTIQFVRNQHLRQLMYSIYKRPKHGIKGYIVTPEDEYQPLKEFSFKSKNYLTEYDCILTDQFNERNGTLVTNNNQMF